MRKVKKPTLQTALSTGLIVLEPTQVVIENAEFRWSSKFDASTFDATNMSSATIVGPVSYGIATKGLEHPLGTGSDFVVQDFDPQSSVPAPGIYSTDVTGFNPRLDCDIPQIDKNSIGRYQAPWINIVGELFVANITTPSCKINNAIIA